MMMKVCERGRESEKYFLYESQNGLLEILNLKI